MTRRSAATLAERRMQNSCGPIAPQAGPRRRHTVVGAAGRPFPVAPFAFEEGDAGPASLPDTRGLPRSRR